MTRIPVRFHGEGSGTAELSWGQREMWANIHRCTSNQLTLAGVLPAQPGTKIDDVAAELAYLMGRHQALRTTIGPGADGRLQQRVADHGENYLEIIDTEGADPSEVAEIHHIRLRETRFDFATDWPIRMAAIQHHGVITHIVTAYCHLSLDAGGMTALVADLNRRDPVTGQATGPVTGMSTLEQARRQATPAIRRQGEASLRHWERMLRTIPPRRFPDTGGKPDGGFEDAHYSSPATWAALRMIAARHQVGTKTVMLAAYATTLTRVTGRHPIMAQTVVSNRFRPGFADSMSTVSQTGLFVVDVAGISFDEAIDRTRQASTNLYKNAYYDPELRDELIATIGRERGEPIDVSCFYNDRRPDDDMTEETPTDLAALRSRSVLRWLRLPYQPDERLFFIVEGRPDPNIEEPGEDLPNRVIFKVRADTRAIGPADVEALVYGIESLLIDTAQR